MLAFLASFFFFLAIAIVKFTYTIYPFLTFMDMQLGRAVIAPLFCTIQAAIMRKDIYTIPRGTRLTVLLRILTATAGLICYLWGV